MIVSRCVKTLKVFTVLAASLLPLAGLSQSVTLVQTSSRYAGTGNQGFTGDFGAATSVALSQPSYVVFDTIGNEYLSDTGNNCVRRIDTSGNITTVLGLVVTGQGDTCNTSSNTAPTAAQGLYKPTGLAVDVSNNLYVADAGHNCVRMLAPGTTGTANLTTVAGTCTTVSALSPTPSPSGLAVDASKNLYISIQDTEILPVVSNYQVLKHTSGASSTILCVVAGSPSVLVPGTCSGAANSVVLSSPAGLTQDFSGNIYVADTGNNCIRQVVGNTTPIAIAGRCTNDGTGNTNSAAIRSPFGIVFSPTQSLFLTETNPNIILRYVPATGVLSQVAGLPSGAAGAYATVQDGTAALNIPLNSPRGLVTDNNGNFYVADSQNNIVRELSFNTTFPTTPVNSQSSIQPLTFAVNQTTQPVITLGPDYTQTSTTCSGTLTPAASGAPPATCQVFVRFTPSRPGLRDSALRIANGLNNSIVVQGLQGTGTGALGIFAPGIVNTVASNLAGPTAVAIDSAGNAYILEHGTTSGTADVLELPSSGASNTRAIAQGTGLITPTGIATDAAGNWYVADAAQGTVSRFGADGSINLSYLSGLTVPSALAVDGFGNLFVAQQGSAHNVIEAYVSGPIRIVAGSGTDPAANGVASGNSLLVSPAGLTIDLNGVLYIADSGGHRVYGVDRSGLIHLIAGNGTTTPTNTGVALGTALIAPVSIAADAAADLYIADQGANVVYVVYAAGTSGANIARILGTGTPGNTGDGGPSILGQVNGPLSVAVDSSSNAFIVDGGNNSVRKITYPNPTVAFGNVPVGQTATPKLQFFGNVGTDNLILTTAIGTSDGHFSIYAPTTTCGTAILPGAVCDIAFTFTPAAPQPYTATSTLTSNSFNSPEPITLTGTGGLQLTLPITPTAPTEVYGHSFPISESTATGSNPAATGTLTYSVNGQTICSVTGTLSPSGTCNAPNSGLSVGTYPVVITYSGDSNYIPSTSSTTLTVTPAPLTITVNNVSRPYGQPNPTFTGTITGTAPGDTILTSFTTTATQSSPAGAYPITATLTTVGTTSLSNYTVVNTPGTLTITQIALTVTVLNATRQYGQPNPAFTNTISGALPGDILTFNYSTPATITSPVGTYPITLTVGGSAAANYTITVIPGTLTVTPAPLTLTVANATRPYGVANPTFTGTISGALNGDTFTTSFSTTATIASPVGSYPITGAVSGPAASNYTVTVVPGTLTITKASTTLNVTANNATRVYGAANPTFTSTITGALNGDTFTITYTTSATAASPVGTYTITPVVSGAALANYNLTTTNGTLTITPAPLTVTASNATRPYGTANPAFTGTTTGLVNGDTITTTFSTTATIASPVGTYPITPTVSGAALANYTLTTVNGTLTITQATAAVTIAVANATRQYGSPNPTFTGTIAGTLNGDVLTVTYGTSATVTSPVGTYPITATVSGSAAANYNIIVTPGTLTVTPAPLTLTVANATRPYGVANPTFTGTIQGALNGDTFTSSFSTTATITSPVGTYPITGTVSGPAASNYTVTVVPGTLTITKATTSLNVTANNFSRVYGAANPTFTSTIAGALNGDTFTITYTVTATPASPVGTYTITPVVSGAALANYTLTTGNGTLTITPAPLSVTANNATRPYGTANPTFTGTTTGLVNGDTVTVTYSTTATITSPVGTYPIVPAVSGAALSNYTLTTTNGTLTITQAALAATITVNNATRPYGSPNPVFTGTITGAVNGDILTATYSTTATTTSPVGTYPITATLGGANAANYTVIVIPGTLTVTPAATTTVVVTSGSPSIVGASVTFTATVSSTAGIPGGTVTFTSGTLTLTGTLNASGVASVTTTALPVGSQLVTASYGGATNFAPSAGTVTQTVTLATGAFTLSANPPTQYIRGAGSTVYNVIVTPVGSFTGPVALTCSGLPADATCVFSSPTVTLATGAASPVTMTVTTTNADAKLLVPANPFRSSDFAPITAAAIFPFELTGFSVLFAGARRRRTITPTRKRWLTALVLSVGMIALAGCNCITSVYQTYTITVTGVATNGNAPTQTTSVLLSVGQQ